MTVRPTLPQNVGSWITFTKLSAPMNSIPPRPEARFQTVNASTTTDSSGTNVNSVTPTRFGRMNNQPARARGPAWLAGAVGAGAAGATETAISSPPRTGRSPPGPGSRPSRSQP